MYGISIVAVSALAIGGGNHKYKTSGVMITLLNHRLQRFRLNLYKFFLCRRQG